MVNPVNPHSDAIRKADQVSLTGGIKASPKAVKAPSQEDTVELSAAGRDLETYMNALQQAPDIRPDVVGKARAVLAVDYPPLDVIAGIVNLVGGLKGQFEQLQQK